MKHRLRNIGMVLCLSSYVFTLLIPLCLGYVLRGSFYDFLPLILIFTCLLGAALWVLFQSGENRKIVLAVVFAFVFSFIAIHPLLMIMITRWNKNCFDTCQRAKGFSSLNDKQAEFRKIRGLRYYLWGAPDNCRALEKEIKGL